MGTQSTLGQYPDHTHHTGSIPHTAVAGTGIEATYTREGGMRI